MNIRDLLMDGFTHSTRQEHRIRTVSIFAIPITPDTPLNKGSFLQIVTVID